MKLCTWILPLVVLGALASVSSASITDYGVAADGDGAISCTYTWDTPSQTLAIDGVQYQFRPGHILTDEDGMIASSTDDPTVRVINSIENDTGFAWTGYEIKLGIGAKNASTALTNLALVAGALPPSDWTTSITQSLTLMPSYTDADGRVLDNYYIAVIDYSAGLTGTPVANGESIDLSYTAAFQGATSYITWQEMTPTPEPATLSLLAIGGVLAIFRRRQTRKA